MDCTDYGLDFERLACHVLKLVHPSDLKRARSCHQPKVHFRIVENDRVLDDVIGLYLEKLQFATCRVADGILRMQREIYEKGRSPERDVKLQQRMDDLNRALANRAVLQYSDFVAFNGEDDEGEICRSLLFRENITQVVRCYARQSMVQVQCRKQFTSIRHEYRRYLKEVVPELYEVLTRDVQAFEERGSSPSTVDSCNF